MTKFKHIVNDNKIYIVGITLDNESIEQVLDVEHHDIYMLT